MCRMASHQQGKTGDGSGVVVCVLCGAGRVMISWTATGGWVPDLYGGAFKSAVGVTRGRWAGPVRR